MKARIYLTFDIEPDYARTSTYRILDRTGPFFDWVRGEQIPITAFVIGKLFELGHPILDRFQQQGIPMEVHGYSHAVDTFGTMHSSHADEIEKGTEAYRRRFGQAPIGYRAPSGIISEADLQLLARLGYRYDASIFPTRRPHRFDFSHLPHHPFRWQGLDLLEIPFGLLTASLPAGLTFMNLLGPGPSARLGRRRAQGPVTTPGSGPVGYLVDGHFHNLFHDPAALRRLPAGMQGIYQLGRLQGGLSALKKIVSRWRKDGFEFGHLQKDVLNLESHLLPEIPMAPRR